MRYFRALLLTEGAHGMVSQVEGLAKALKLDFNHCFVNLKKPWKYFPINLVPVSKSVIDGKIPDQIENQVLISCGKNSIISSLFLKRNNKNLFNIHIQNPKINFSNFDLIVAPEHDQIKGNNVLNTFGALHYITKQEIDNSSNVFSKYNLSENDKIVSLILGGPNRYYDFNEIDLGNIFLLIKDNFLDKNFKLILVRSRRTPDNIIDFAKKFFLDSAVIIDFVSKEFYLSALKLSKTIIVTCDSTSMISECAITQKPIFVAKMKAKRRNNRFEYFLNSFREKGIVKFLGENIDNWSYPELDETKRIARIIKERLN
ncbi:MAG: mitochondrial fission ELM1 family protein [Candidatus Fonsibacter sp.]|jgi:mitochondrial fission protein ELM1|nr:mitochondrial fission ELM1 family protein [Candidatus Fonsibacter sp.]